MCNKFINIFSAFFGEEEIARELFKHIPAHTKSTLPTKPENALVEDLCYECDLTALHLASYSGSENVVRAILNQPMVDVKGPSTPSGEIIYNWVFCSYSWGEQHPNLQILAFWFLHMHDKGLFDN